MMAAQPKASSQGLQNEAETTAEGERFFRGKMGIRDFAWQVTQGSLLIISLYWGNACF